MTSTMPPHGPGSRRAVPVVLDDAARARLRWLLDDPDSWVLRPGWEPFLCHGDRAPLVRTDALRRDELLAALAWLRQQRHALYTALEHPDRGLAAGLRAPDGWLESSGLWQRLERLLAEHTHTR